MHNHNLLSADKGKLLSIEVAIEAKCARCNLSERFKDDVRQLVTECLKVETFSLNSFPPIKSIVGNMIKLSAPPSGCRPTES